MAAFANEYRAPPGWSVDGLALMAARSAVERAAIACARSRLDGDDWVGALDLLSADTLAPYASVELECGAAQAGHAASTYWLHWRRALASLGIAFKIIEPHASFTA